ncbi:MAG: glycosyltransferase family 4 protein, partial [Gemmatimonadota bacterium]
FRPAQAEGKARLRERLGLPERARIVVFAGRLVSWKGPLILLEAWRRLVNDQAASPATLGGPQPLLLFLGAGGADLHNCEAEARAFVAAHGMEGGVRFLGDVTAVADFPRSADAFAFPSAREAFGMAVVEAMATGLPVVTTSVAGLADYVRDGENALAVDPEDPAGLRRALGAVLEDPALRARLSEGAVRTARRFSQEGVVDAHVELFRRLLSG